MDTTNALPPIPTGQRIELLWWRSSVVLSYAVVASINVHDDTHGDWAAYLAACMTQEQEALEIVARTGAKLSEAEARAFARGRFELDRISYRQ